MVPRLGGFLFGSMDGSYCSTAAAPATSCGTSVCVLCPGSNYGLAPPLASSDAGGRLASLGLATPRRQLYLEAGGYASAWEVLGFSVQS